MDIAQSWGWMTLVEMAMGTLSIFLGYRLFCDLPSARNRVMRLRLVTNLASGTLLALFGMAILIAAAHGHERRGVNANTPRATHSLKSPATHRYRIAERTV
jgi:hypothetical protein